jgi:spore maturation protein CgeB
LKILIVGYFSAFWHEAAWVKALRELNHEVAEFRIEPYFKNALCGRFQNRFLIGPTITTVNSDLVKTVANINPDIVVFYRALPITSATIKKLASTHPKHILVCYNNDNAFGPIGNKAYWRLYKETIPFYDLHLAYRPSDVPFLNVGPAVHVLQPHNLPWLHRVVPQTERTGWESDICFLGHFEPDRRKNELDTLMRKVPAHYRLHGSLWAENSTGMPWKGMPTHELQGEEYVRALNGSKIALVFFSTWNADTFTRRVFEIPACGTMMLSQRTDAMLDLYAENLEAVYFDSPEELVDKARYYLKHDDARRKIAAAGHKRCLESGYDIYSRMQEWIAVVEGLRQIKGQ